MKASLGCGLGEALEPALQAFLLTSTESHNRARVFTSVALVDTVAELVGGPLAAELLAVGRRDGRPSSGISFLASAVSHMPLYFSRAYQLIPNTGRICSSLYSLSIYNGVIHVPMDADGEAHKVE